ncbi:MAG: 2Fe-2S iron-sulfur cluster binding domain-containing protein [Cocleimonas sp.]
MSLNKIKIQVNARNRSHNFEAALGEKLLDAGLSNAVNLPYECGSGTCGTCKARIISGKLKNLWPEAPGNKFVKPKKGEFLMCQCSAASDVVIEVGSFVPTMEAGACVPSSMTGIVSSTKQLTSDVMSVFIELEQPLDFDAGQFMLLKFPEVEGFRGWSMVNYEQKTKTLEFVIKKKPDGILSDQLFSKNCTGQEVELFGPLGSATFYSNLTKNILCIAGGSGIAGIMSILSRAEQDGYFTQYKGYVFFGVRTALDAFFLDELSKFKESSGDNLKIVIAFSEDSDAKDLQSKYPLLDFDEGFIHEVTERYMEGKFDKIRAYIAGPTPLVNGSIGMLLKSRVSTDDIRYDKFS